MSVSCPLCLLCERLTSCKVTDARDEEVLVEFLDTAGDSILGHTRIVVGKINGRWAFVSVS